MQVDKDSLIWYTQNRGSANNASRIYHFLASLSSTDDTIDTVAVEKVQFTQLNSRLLDFKIHGGLEYIVFFDPDTLGGSFYLALHSAVGLSPSFTTVRVFSNLNSVLDSHITSNSINLLEMTKYRKVLSVGETTSIDFGLNGSFSKTESFSFLLPTYAADTCYSTDM